MDSDKESERLFSLGLSRLMEDIGVKKRMIDSQRKSHLEFETIENVNSLMTNANYTTYIVGSQIEVTTTPDMASDIDYLQSDKRVHVILKQNKWQYGKPNLLVLRDELTPPQVCYLQRLRHDCSKPAEQTEGPDDVLIDDGRVLVANTQAEHQEYHARLGKVIRRGPSISSTDKADYVEAFQCAELPEECQFMFHRPHPGHWPRKKIMERARNAVVFLVPQGYSESPPGEETCKRTALVCMIPSTSPNYPYSKWQWRFSTTLMERFLMFDLTAVQVKVYTIAKVIRKEVLKPLYGDRFSSFHMKTAMMYTVENYPHTIWREDNIVQCVSLILTTLTRWLKQKYCPHFTISGVNLFVGKLHKWELPKLCAMIFDLINTKLQCLFHINMDYIGMRLQHYTGHAFPEGYIFNVGFGHSPLLQIRCIDLWFKVITLFLRRVEYTLSHYLLEMVSDNLKSKSNSQSDMEKEIVSLVTPFIHGILASRQASRCIYLGEPITQEILNLYDLSFGSDLMSSRLKYASMLYCCGQYEEAADVLTHCEGLLGPNVYQWWVHVDKTVLDPGSFQYRPIENQNVNSSKQLLTRHLMVCIMFSKEEIHCIPKHLAYELYRCIESEDIEPGDEWKPNVVIDCIPFLYYLQHLTYRELHQPKKAFTAGHHLIVYTLGTSSYGHKDTALNMLGHCFELRKIQDMAWKMYKLSLEITNKDNPAKWHLARIVHEYVKNITPPSGMLQLK